MESTNLTIPSITDSYRDVRSGSVPTIRHKTHRKRYRNVNAALIGSVASQFVTPGISNHMHDRVVWNNKNKFKMPARIPAASATAHSSTQSGAPRLNRKFLAEEIARAHEPDAIVDNLSDNSSSSGSDYEYEEAEFGGFEARGELVWDALIKGAEEKYEEGVFRKEWEVVEEEEDEVVREVDGFELV
ncbi:hypothetical protein BJ508DRAFT_309987 [Ascobolus immersus RN42]|uniref:Uncharacterized protein n=1 Tax=Ascobolus immersus RN42 TaxID=1160509 RepID=A0A3N4HUU3_ASCIM|nr:hypothetical protein BJ508DRAFT_309987 [Ascobolus immersus RN42]